MSRMSKVLVVGQRAGQAAAAATFLGGPGVALVGCAGSEELMTSMGTELGRLQVDVSRLRGARSDGDALRPDDVCGPEVANADVLLVGADIPPETARAAMYYARGKVMFDPTPAPGRSHQGLGAWIDSLAPFVHLLVPDPTTVAALDVSNPLDAEIYQQAEDLAERLRVNVVVPPGPADALLIGQGIGAERMEVPGDVENSDAGDCFRGVLAVLLAEKTPLPEAVRIAVRAASFATITGGLPARSATAAAS